MPKRTPEEERSHFERNILGRTMDAEEVAAYETARGQSKTLGDIRTAIEVIEAKRLAAQLITIIDKVVDNANLVGLIDAALANRFQKVPMYERSIIARFLMDMERERKR